MKNKFLLTLAVCAVVAFGSKQAHAEDVVVCLEVQSQVGPSQFAPTQGALVLAETPTGDRIIQHYSNWSTRTLDLTYLVREIMPDPDPIKETLYILGVAEPPLNAHQQTLAVVLTLNEQESTAEFYVLAPEERLIRRALLSCSFNF